MGLYTVVYLCFFITFFCFFCTKMLKLTTSTSVWGRSTQTLVEIYNYYCYLYCTHSINLSAIHAVKQGSHFHPYLTCSDIPSWSGRIKTFLLRRQNDYFGDAFGHALAAFGRQLQPPQKTAAIKKCFFLILFNRGVPQ